MEYGYSSSTSTSPDQQSFTISSMYDTTPESSTPASPGELQQFLAYTSFPGYDMTDYQGSTNVFPMSESMKFPPAKTGPSSSQEHDRRKKKKGGDSTQEKEDLPTMHLRRRAQNRASQRAFRERKERHLKGLEHQLDLMNDKHRDLLVSYNRQADEVVKLNTRIEELNSELAQLRSINEGPFNQLGIPEKFDAIPRSDMTYAGPEFYFDRGVINMPPGSGHDDML